MNHTEPFARHMAALQRIRSTLGGILIAVIVVPIVMWMFPFLSDWGILTFCSLLAWLVYVLLRAFRVFRHNAAIADTMQAMLRTMCHQPNKMTPEEVAVEQMAFRMLLPEMLEDPEVFRDFWQKGTSFPSRARFAKYVEHVLRQKHESYTDQGHIAEDDPEFLAFVDQCKKVDANVRRNAGSLAMYDMDKDDEMQVTARRAPPADAPSDASPAPKAETVGTSA